MSHGSLTEIIYGLEFPVQADYLTLQAGFKFGPKAQALIGVPQLIPIPLVRDRIKVNVFLRGEALGTPLDKVVSLIEHRLRRIEAGEAPPSPAKTKSTPKPKPDRAALSARLRAKARKRRERARR